MNDEYGFLGITPEHVATAADIRQRLEQLMRSVTITVTAVRHPHYIGYEIIANAKQDFFVGAREVIGSASWEHSGGDDYLDLIARQIAHSLGKAAFLAEGGK